MPSFEFRGYLTHLEKAQQARAPFAAFEISGFCSFSDVENGSSGSEDGNLLRWAVLASVVFLASVVLKREVAKRVLTLFWSGMTRARYVALFFTAMISSNKFDKRREDSFIYEDTGSQFLTESQPDRKICRPEFLGKHIPKYRSSLQNSLRYFLKKHTDMIEPRILTSSGFFGFVLWFTGQNQTISHGRSSYFTALVFR